MLSDITQSHGPRKWRANRVTWGSSAQYLVLGLSLDGQMLPLVVQKDRIKKTSLRKYGAVDDRQETMLPELHGISL